MLALSLARRIDVAKPCEIDRSVVRESDRAKGAGPIRRAGFLPFQMFCILLFPPSSPIVPLPRKIAPDKMLSSPTPSLTRISVSSGPFDGTRMTRFVPGAADGHFLRVSPVGLNLDQRGAHSSASGYSIFGEHLQSAVSNEANAGKCSVGAQRNQISDFLRPFDLTLRTTRVVFLFPLPSR
jgi:hypothetical protein